MCVYSAAGQFVNPSFSIFLHKYDPKQTQIFPKFLQVDTEKPIKQMRLKYFLYHLFIHLISWISS